MALHSDNIAPDNAAPDHVTSDKRALSEDEPAAASLTRLQRAGHDLSLRVVPVELVVPHEHYHERRVEKLKQRLLQEAKLINPPIVAQYGGKYVVLDGATRSTALRQLGYPYIIVQVVYFAQQEVQLSSWNHVVRGGSEDALLAELRSVKGLRLAPVDAVNGGEPEINDGVVGYLVTANHDCYVIGVEAGEQGRSWLEVLNDMVAAYGLWGNVERTLSQDVASLTNQFPDLAALVIFPRFSPQTILALADQGRTVPAGITRFVIPGRILRLNAPLEKLMADEPLATKQQWLDQLIHQKVRERQVRFYEEPVVLLDE